MKPGPRRNRGNKLALSMPARNKTTSVKVEVASLVVLSDGDIIEDWRKIGASEGLSSDTDVAKFLISIHKQKRKDGEKNEHSCGVCRRPMCFFCPSCSSLPSTQPSKKGGTKQQPPKSQNADKSSSPTEKKKYQRKKDTTQMFWDSLRQSSAELASQSKSGVSSDSPELLVPKVVLSKLNSTKTRQKAKDRASSVNQLAKPTTSEGENNNVDYVSDYGGADDDDDGGGSDFGVYFDDAIADAHDNSVTDCAIQKVVQATLASLKSEPNESSLRIEKVESLSAPNLDIPSLHTPSVPDERATTKVGLPRKTATRTKVSTTKKRKMKDEDLDWDDDGKDADWAPARADDSDSSVEWEPTPSPPNKKSKKKSSIGTITSIQGVDRDKKSKQGATVSKAGNTAITALLNSSNTAASGNASVSDVFGKDLNIIGTSNKDLLPESWGETYIELTREQFYTGTISVPVHTRDKTGRVIYYNHMCSKCKTVFTKKSLYNIHVKDNSCTEYIGEGLPPESLQTLKEIEKKYFLKCSKCSHLYTTKYKLCQHERVAHAKGNAKECILCGWFLKDLYALRRHVEIKKEEDKQCPTCGMVFASKCQKKPHSDVCTKHNKHPCLHCDASFRTIRERRAHSKLHHLFHCNLCRESFPTVKERHEHVAELHPEQAQSKGKSKHKLCSTCGKAVVAANFKTHLLTHTDARPFHCDQCPRSFKSSTKMRSHQKLSHGPKREVPYKHQCEHCGKKFKRSCHLKAHVQWHTGFLYNCGMCNARFNYKVSLRHHMVRVHTDAKTIPCPKCDLMFKMKEDLVTHLAIHDNLKKFRCKLCSSGFNRRDYLLKHMAVHTRSKPCNYKCRHCGRGFVVKNQLRYHIVRQHGDFTDVPHNRDGEIIGLGSPLPDDSVDKFEGEDNSLIVYNSDQHEQLQAVESIMVVGTDGSYSPPQQLVTDAGSVETSVFTERIDYPALMLPVQVGVMGHVAGVSHQWPSTSGSQGVTIKIRRKGKNVQHFL